MLCLGSCTRQVLAAAELARYSGMNALQCDTEIQYDLARTLPNDFFALTIRCPVLRQFHAGKSCVLVKGCSYDSWHVQDASSPCIL